ncbi:hypothetical protein KC887_08155, partial [Candidatus Kaiserbacteria bacterium]|nr:hypothetical protein [Candidatus Kaiserbacteria bacterium]
ADVKRKSKAFQAIIKEVTNDGKNSYAAAKYLIEEPWKQKRTKAAKEESRATTEEALISSEVSEDLDRLREAGLLN